MGPFTGRLISPEHIDLYKNNNLMWEVSGAEPSRFTRRISPVTGKPMCSGVQRGRDGPVLHRRQPGGPEELDDVHQVRPERAGAEPGGGSDRQQHLLPGRGG